MIKLAEASRMRFSDGELSYDEFEPEPTKFNLRSALLVWIAPLLIFTIAIQVREHLVGSSLLLISMMWQAGGLCVSLHTRSQRPPKYATKDEGLTTLLGQTVMVYPSRTANMLLIQDDMYVSSAGVQSFTTEELRAGARWLDRSPSFPTLVKTYVVAFLSIALVYGMIPTVVSAAAKGLGYAERPAEFLCQLFGMLILVFVADTRWCNSIFRRDEAHHSEALLGALRKTRASNLTKERIARLESQLEKSPKSSRVEAILSE